MASAHVKALKGQASHNVTNTSRDSHIIYIYTYTESMYSLHHCYVCTCDFWCCHHRPSCARSIHDAVPIFGFACASFACPVSPRVLQWMSA